MGKSISALPTSPPGHNCTESGSRELEVSRHDTQPEEPEQCHPAIPSARGQGRLPKHERGVRRGHVHAPQRRALRPRLRTGVKPERASGHWKGDEKAPLAL